MEEVQTSTSTVIEKRKYTVQDIPRLPREVAPLASFVNVHQLLQRGPLFRGPGEKRETGRYKIRPVDAENVRQAKKYASEQGLKHILVRQQQQQQRQQLDIIKKQQALLLMCRTYVGSINFELNEAMLKKAFEPFGPVKAVSLTFDTVTNRHKGFAFLEYETPEAAQLSIEQMNGVILGGRNIKVGRPSNMPQAQPIIDRLTEEAKNYNRIYVASIHPDLTENEIKSVFEAFGKILNCTVAKDPATNKHKGYGFIEFESIQAAQDAITSMNLFDLGGQHLRVGKAITPPEGLSASTQPVTSPMPTATALAMAKITAELQAKEVETIIQPPIPEPEPQQYSSIPLVLPTDTQKTVTTAADDSIATISQQEELSVKGREQRHLLMQKLNQRRLDSRVCLIKNMVGPEAVDADLQQDVTDECSKYGDVVKVIIYTEQQGENDQPEQTVKIFVEFQTGIQAEKAVESLRGRYFAGRLIKSELYDQTAYLAEDFSG